MSSGAVSLALFFYLFIFWHFAPWCNAEACSNAYSTWMRNQSHKEKRDFFVTLLHDAKWKWWSFLQRRAQCMTNNQTCNHSILYHYITRIYHSHKSLRSSVVSRLFIIIIIIIIIITIIIIIVVNCKWYQPCKHQLDLNTTNKQVLLQAHCRLIWAKIN